MQGALKMSKGKGVEVTITGDGGQRSGKEMGKTMAITSKRCFSFEPKIWGAGVWVWGEKDIN